MAGRKVTLSEALGIKKMLMSRHQELVSLRNNNATKNRTYYGANADKFTEEKVLYDVKHLDNLVSNVAKEIRVLDMALKRTNAKVEVEDYLFDDSVMGELK